MSSIRRTRRRPSSISRTRGVKYLPDFYKATSIRNCKLCMRWTATTSWYEQRDPAPTVGIDAFCGKSTYSRLEHYTPWRAGAQYTSQSLCANSHCASVGETGLEPATPGPPDQYSNHLSYSPRRAYRL